MGISPEFVTAVARWYGVACQGATGSAPALWSRVMQTGLMAGLTREAIKPAAEAIIARISASLGTEAIVTGLAANFGRIVATESLAGTARVSVARASAGACFAVVAIVLTCGATSQEVKETEYVREFAAHNYPGYLERYVTFAMKRFGQTGRIPPEPMTFEEFVQNPDSAIANLRHMRNQK